MLSTQQNRLDILKCFKAAGALIFKIWISKYESQKIRYIFIILNIKNHEKYLRVSSSREVITSFYDMNIFSDNFWYIIRFKSSIIF